MILTGRLAGVPRIPSGKGCVICMYKIAVIGGRDTVMGFKALSALRPARRGRRGSRAGPAQSHAREAMITPLSTSRKTLPSSSRPRDRQIKDRPTPAIILIPGREGSIGLGQSALRARVERAVGTNILGD